MSFRLTVHSESRAFVRFEKQPYEIGFKILATDDDTIVGLVGRRNDAKDVMHRFHLETLENVEFPDPQRFEISDFLTRKVAILALLRLS